MPVGQKPATESVEPNQLIDAARVREQLQRLVAHPLFANSKRSVFSLGGAQGRVQSKISMDGKSGYRSLTLVRVVWASPARGAAPFCNRAEFETGAAAEESPCICIDTFVDRMALVFWSAPAA